MSQKPKNESPSDVYGEQVADIIAGEPRKSDWKPKDPMQLRIVNRRAPASIEDLRPDERTQLAAMFFPEPVEAVVSPDYVVDDFPISLEVAEVVDEAGTVRYRLYGWDFGAAYLMPATGLEVVAWACQHDLEHWHADQRPIFWAMDHAYRRQGHGFRQPLKFCWWDESCWEEIANEERGTVASEPHIRKHLARSAS